MDDLEIERFGGLAGFGGPLSRVRSIGHLSVDALTGDDRHAVERLFAEARDPTEQPRPDEFRYRITRKTDTGSLSIEVPAHRVPRFIEQSIHDELR